MTAYTQARFTVPPPKVSQAEWDRIFKPKPKKERKRVTVRRPARG